MTLKTTAGLALAAGLLAGIPGAFAADAPGANPIFGKAVVTPLTTAENMKVVGKGYYADYYGYYGNLYSTYAIQEGYNGFYYQDATSYYNAYLYAAYASSYYYSAYVNQYYGT